MDSQPAHHDILTREHVHYLGSVARKLGVPEHEIEDLVGETLLKAVELAPGFRGDAKPTTWLYEILKNQWRNRARKRDRRARKSLVYQSSAKPCTSASSVQLAWAERELDAFIDKLPPSQREVFVARALFGRGRAETARILGLPPGAVDRLARKASESFEQRFGAPPREQRRSLPVAFLAPAWWRARAAASSTAGSLTAISLSVVSVVLIAKTTPRASPQPASVVRGSPTAAAVSAASPSSPAAPELREPEAQEPAPDQGAREVQDEGERPDVSPARARRASRPLGHGEQQRHFNQARRLLATDPGRALGHLERIDPKGPLAQLRFASEVRALCELGKLARARRVASAWIEAFPDDEPLLQQSCLGAP